MKNPEQIAKEKISSLLSLYSQTHLKTWLICLNVYNVFMSVELYSNFILLMLIFLVGPYELLGFIGDITIYKNSETGVPEENHRPTANHWQYF
jgi:predicted CDP-diglyceride synthetase/phosphatidate cytidylyltransferase